MKTLITGFILIGIAISSCQGQEIDCSTTALNEKLAELYQEDQAIRNELMPLLGQYQKDGSGKMKLFSLVMKQERQDRKNQEQLSSIFEQCGWPKEISSDAHNTIFLILQHSPDSMMRQYYPLVVEYSEAGLLEQNDRATMYDRLQMRAGKYQKYGTQTFQDDQNRNLVWPIDAPEKLEERRAEVGLPNMSTYFQMARDSMGVEMIWNKDLSLEQALALRKNN